MKTVSVAAAKRDFSEIADRVAQDGARFVVTRRGKPVVALVPVDDAAAVEAYGRPQGLAAVAGLLGDATRLLDAVDETWKARARARDRAAPRLR